MQNRSTLTPPAFKVALGKGNAQVTGLLSKRLEAKHRYNQRSPLAVRTKDGGSMVLRPETGPHTLMADPDFWNESGIIKFLWGTEELTASLSDFLEATEKAYSA